MTMITLSEQNWDQYMYFLIHKARVTWLLAPYFLDLLYFQHNILFNFLLACNPKKFLVDVYKLGCFVLNTVSETKILRDCSLFMGMTGSEKKYRAMKNICSELTGYQIFGDPNKWVLKNYMSFFKETNNSA